MLPVTTENLDVLTLMLITTRESDADRETDRQTDRQTENQREKQGDAEKGI